MKIKDYSMWKAKVLHKIRWYYIHAFQEQKRCLGMYRSYRHYQMHRADKNISRKQCTQYMTKTVNPTAGIGDQMASWITGFYYAKQFGLAYAYSPLYPSDWNTFFGFDEEEINAQDLLRQEGYRRIRLPFFEEQNQQERSMVQKIIDSYQGKRVIFYIEISQVYGEQYGVMDEIRKKFNKAPARMGEQLRYQADQLNIAVHVRRGDITEGQINNNPQLKMRWLDNEYYVNVLTQVTTALPHRRYKIFLFSQGREEEFKEFNQFEEVEYCLDMKAKDSFLHLVRADILITSKSSFSYKPALMSNGIRICPKNFWHGYPEDPKWILADDYGVIEENDIRKLSAYDYES